jgi:hypothetical protein
MYQRIPAPGGENAQEASSVYSTYYGELPMPATSFVTATTALMSVDTPPSVRTVASNASVVQRANRRKGMVATGGVQWRNAPTPQYNDPVDSSKFQDLLVGPLVNYYMNNKWYIYYPAASVMQGGMHNLGWSERVPQLPTRTSGGPGPASMGQAPRFKAVQTVPRYSTMPPTYPTSSARG